MTYAVGQKSLSPIYDEKEWQNSEELESSTTINSGVLNNGGNFHSYKQVNQPCSYFMLPLEMIKKINNISEEIAMNARVCGNKANIEVVDAVLISESPVTLPSFMEFINSLIDQNGNTEIRMSLQFQMNQALQFVKSLNLELESSLAPPSRVVLPTDSKASRGNLQATYSSLNQKDNHEDQSIELDAGEDVNAIITEKKSPFNSIPENMGWIQGLVDLQLKNFSTK